MAPVREPDDHDPGRPDDHDDVERDDVADEAARDEGAGRDSPDGSAGSGDAFDDIVRGLDLDLSFPAEADAPTRPRPRRQDAPEPAARDLDDEPDAVDEQFYRRVDPGPPRPLHRGRAAAWAGLLGAPLLLMLASASGRFLSGAVLLGAALTFVASAIYLIAQLPEHGPSQRDWPDDGAAL